MGRNTVLVLFLIPSFSGLVYVAISLSPQRSDEFSGFLETLAFPALTPLLMLLMLLLRHRVQSIASLGLDFIFAIPGFMAPLALFSAWTLAVSHISGMAWGGIGYFLNAATRYPDLGPVNSSVVLGLMAIFCVAFFPVVISWAYLANWSKLYVYVLATFVLLAYGAILVELDVYLYMAVFYGSDGGSLLFLTYAPLTHTMAFISVCYIVLRVLGESRSPLRRSANTDL